MILKSQCQTKIGDRVFDGGLRQVVTVFDIFGQTSSPYVAVKPCTVNSEKSVNQVLYLFDEEKRKK